MSIICPLLNIFFYAVFARIIFSWIPVRPGTFLAQVHSLLYAITEPVLGPLRRAIPPLRAGGMGIDLSATIVLFGILILRGAIGC